MLQEVSLRVKVYTSKADGITFYIQRFTNTSWMIKPCNIGQLKSGSQTNPLCGSQACGTHTTDGGGGALFFFCFFSLSLSLVSVSMQLA